MSIPTEASLKVLGNPEKLSIYVNLLLNSWFNFFCAACIYLRDRTLLWTRRWQLSYLVEQRNAQSDRLPIVIIGAGYSGLIYAYYLKSRGHKVVILEKNNEVGGTWLLNTYPGCACDVQAHNYSFSFFLNPNWSKKWVGQQEILDYMKKAVKAFDLRALIRFRTEVRRMTWDESRELWRVYSKNLDTGEEECYLGRAIVPAHGPLHLANMPAFEGGELFKGPKVHSSEFNLSKTPVSGKRVAVIGSAASAIQLVPHVAKAAKSVSVFQRTPNWVAPKMNQDVPWLIKSIFSVLPFLNRLYRLMIFSYQEFLLYPMGFEAVNPKVEKFWKELWWSLLPKDMGLEVTKAVTPNYTPGCKRILLSDTWYDTLKEDHVNLVTTAISGLTPKGVQTVDQKVHDADIIVYATGFKIFRNLDSVVGRHNESLLTCWTLPEEEAAKEGHALKPWAYRGSFVPNFPNMFMALGPGTGLGHNSVLSMVEAQAEMMVSLLDEMDHKNIRSIEVRPEQYKTTLIEHGVYMKDRVWVKGGCKSWYLKEGGTLLYPHRVTDFQRDCTSVTLDDFVCRYSKKKDSETPKIFRSVVSDNKHS